MKIITKFWHYIFSLCIWREGNKLDRQMANVCFTLAIIIFVVLWKLK